MAGSNFGKGMKITQAERKNLSKMTEVPLSEKKDGISTWSAGISSEAKVSNDNYVDTLVCAHFSFDKKFVCSATLKSPKGSVNFDLEEKLSKGPPKNIFFGDIDGDGDSDLAVKLHDDTIRVYHNQLLKKAPKSVMNFLKKIADKTPAAEQHLF